MKGHHRRTAIVIEVVRRINLATPSLSELHSHSMDIAPKTKDEVIQSEAQVWLRSKGTHQFRARPIVE